MHKDGTAVVTKIKNVVPSIRVIVNHEVEIHKMRLFASMLWYFLHYLSGQINNKKIYFLVLRPPKVILYGYRKQSHLQNCLQSSCRASVLQQKSAGQVSCQGLATEVKRVRLTDDFEPIIRANSVRQPITWGKGRDYR